MIHAVGDSHAAATFVGIRAVATYHVGPVTMWRLGNQSDVLIPAIVSGLGLGTTDILILCCGEIDVRCHVGPQAKLQGRTPEAVIVDLATRYLDRAATLDVGDASVGVLAVVPPVPAERAVNAAFPVSGSLADRVTWTDRLNLELRAGCANRALTFVDVNTPFRATDGSMRLELSDGCVHIKDMERVLAVLNNVIEGLL
jgi:hypothetical protein